MASVKVFPPITALLLAAAIIIITSLGAEVQAQSFSKERRELAERTKRGNKTFDCSPSGPCVTCSYSEKSDDEFQCSETGYHMPYKCIEVQGYFKEVNKEQIGRGSYHVGTQSGITNGYKDMELQNQETQKKGNQGNGTGRRERNWRKLSETSYSLEDGKQTYHIFKSCVPPADEEKLSVLGFEGIILCLLLISSPIMYYRKKRNFVMPGATRIPTNSRF